MDLFWQLIVPIFATIVWWVLTEEEEKPPQDVKKLSKKIRAPCVLLLLLIPTMVGAQSMCPDDSSFVEGLPPTACSDNDGDTGCDFVSVIGDLDDGSISTYWEVTSGTESEYFEIGDVYSTRQRGEIFAIVVHVDAKRSHVNDDFRVGFWSSGSGADWGSDISIATGSFTEAAYYFYHNPDGNVNWEWEDVDGLEVIMEATVAVSSVQVAEIWVEILRSTVTVNPNATTGMYITLDEFMNDFAGMKNDGVVLLAGDYHVMDTSGATISDSFDADGGTREYTLWIKPNDLENTTGSSNGKTGTIVRYDISGIWVGLNFAMSSGQGNVIIDGLTFDVTPSTATPSTFFNWAPSTTGYNLAIRNCVFHGQTQGGNGIFINNTAASNVQVYNNYVYDWNYGIRVGASASFTGNSFINHNTVYDCNYGIDLNSKDIRVDNNWVDDSDNTDFSNHTAVSEAWTNACSDSTCSTGEFNETESSLTVEQPTGDTADIGCAVILPTTPTTHYDKVDEATHDGWTTYVGCSTCSWLTDEDWYTINTPSTQTGKEITKVRVFVQISGSSGNSFYVGLRDQDTTVTEDWSIPYTLSGDDWVFATSFDRDFYLHPTGITWEWAHLDNLEVGLLFHGGAQGYVTHVKVTVYYSEDQGNIATLDLTYTSGTSTPENDEYFHQSGELLEDAATDMLLDGNLYDADAIYQFEDGNQGLDSSGNDNDLTVVEGGTLDYYSSPYGMKCGYFTNNDHMYLSGELQSGNGDFSVGFYFLPLANSSFVLVSESSAEVDGDAVGTENEWEINYTGSNYLCFRQYYGNGSSNSNLCTQATFPIYNMYYVVVSYDSSTYDATIFVHKLNNDRFILEGNSHSVENTDNYGAFQVLDFSFAMNDAFTAPPFTIGASWNSTPVAINEAVALIDHVIVIPSTLTRLEMEGFRKWSYDGTNRIRGYSDISLGAGTVPDIGAYEDITARDYYVRCDGSGSNSNDGTTYVNAWSNMNNLQNMIMSHGDNLKIDEDCNGAGDGVITTQAKIRGLGTTDDEIDLQACDNGTNCGATTLDKPEFTVSNISGMFISATSNANLSGMEFDDNGNHGLYAVNSHNLEIDDILCEDNENSGFRAIGGHTINVDDSEFIWNQAGIWWMNVYGDNTLNQITNSTMNHNGQLRVGGGHGIYLRGSSNQGYEKFCEEDRSTFCDEDSDCDGACVFQLTGYDPVTVNNCDISYNGTIGMSLGRDSIVEYTGLHHNGGGWNHVGTYLLEGSMTGTDFEPETWVAQDTDANPGNGNTATGFVFKCNDPKWDREDVGDVLAIYSYSYWVTGTFAGTGTVYLCEDSNCTTYVDSGSRYYTVTGLDDSHKTIPDSVGGGGGLDARNADDSIIRFFDISYTYWTPGKPDAYGINIDDESNNLKVYMGVASYCDGPGFAFHNSGHGNCVDDPLEHCDVDGDCTTGTCLVEPCYLMNTLSYYNTQMASDAGGIQLGFWCKESDANCFPFLSMNDCHAVIINNISLYDGEYPLIALGATREENIVLENNIWWQGSASDYVINWKYSVPHRTGTTDADGACWTAASNCDDVGEYCVCDADENFSTSTGHADVVEIDDYICFDDTDPVECTKITAVYNGYVVTEDDYSDKFSTAYRVGGGQYKPANVDKDTCTQGVDCDWYDTFGVGDEEYSQDPLVNVGSGEYRLNAGSIAIDTGTDLSGSTYIDCTPGNACDNGGCCDYYNAIVPIDGDESGVAQWDIGLFEYFLGYIWGDDTPPDGYRSLGWTEDDWDPGESSGEITGDEDTGVLDMDTDEYFVGPVKDLGDTSVKFLSIDTTDTSGSGELCWRGSATAFTQFSVDIEWTVVPEGGANKSWRYIQIGTAEDACSDIPYAP